MSTLIRWAGMRTVRMFKNIVLWAEIDRTWSNWDTNWNSEAPYP